MNENQWSDQEGIEKTDWKGKNEKKLASLSNKIPKWNLTRENLLELLPNQIEGLISHCSHILIMIQ